MRPAGRRRIVFDFRITLLHRNSYFIAMHNIFYRLDLGGLRRLLILRRRSNIFGRDGLGGRPGNLG